MLKSPGSAASAYTESTAKGEKFAATDGCGYFDAADSNDPIPRASESTHRSQAP